MSQVSHCREDAESAQKTSYGVDNHHNEGVPQDWSVKLVVRAECNKASKSDTNRVEHLRSCINPYLKIKQMSLFQSSLVVVRHHWFAS